MNAAKLVWSVVTSVSLRDPLACEVSTKQYLHNCADFFNHRKFSHKFIFQNLNHYLIQFLHVFEKKNHAPEDVK
jgi:hypothetical protein